MMLVMRGGMEHAIKSYEYEAMMETKGAVVGMHALLSRPFQRTRNGPRSMMTRLQIERDDLWHADALVGRGNYGDREPAIVRGLLAAQRGSNQVASACMAAVEQPRAIAPEAVARRMAVVEREEQEDIGVYGSECAFAS